MSSSLEKRLKTLEDERAIIATLHAYGHSIDYGLKERFADLFTEEATYLVVDRGGVPAPTLAGLSQPPAGLKGRDSILRYVRAHTNAPAKWHKHFMVEPVISWLGDDEVSVDSYFTRLDENETGPYMSSFGRYRDRVVRCPDGRWRFKERICEVESRSHTRR